jgi:hypothetical protein
MAECIIPCTVTLIGASMIVKADSAEDAERKAAAEQWEDIIYDTASLMDWTIAGKPKQSD